MQDSKLSAIADAPHPIPRRRPRSARTPVMLSAVLIVLAAAVLCGVVAHITRPRAFAPRRRHRSRP